MLVDVLTPTFNEEEAVLRCYEAVRSVFDKFPNLEYRHTFIDNASSDSTVDIILSLIARDRRVRLIQNNANFGAEKSGFHGIQQLDGDLFSVVLCDLQTPTETLEEMLKLWDGEFDAILALKETEKARGIDRLRHLYYRVMSRISDRTHLEGFLGFGLFSSRVLEILKSQREPSPYFRGLIPNLGISYKTIRYVQPPRGEGRTHHGLADLIDYFFLGLVASSTKLLSWSVLLGLFIGFISALIAIFYTIAKLIWWTEIPVGIAPILIGTFFLGGLILGLQGLVGLFVARLLEQFKNQPLVIEKNRVNF